MRKYIVYALLTLSSFGLSAQSLSKSETEAIKGRFGEFLSYTSQQDFEKVLGYLHPKQFESNSTISMKEMASMLQFLKIKLEFESAEMGELEGLSSQGENKYALADYTFDLKLTLNEQNKGFADQIMNGLNGQFGKNNVSYDAATKVIRAKGLKYVVWVKEKQLQNQWYLVDFDPKNPNVWRNIVPEKILTEAVSKARK